MAWRGFDAIAAGSFVNRASTRRSGQVVFVLFLFPLLVISLIGFAMRGYTESSMVIGFVDRARNAASQALIAAIDAEPHLRVREFDDRERLRMATFRGRLNGGMFIPAGWEGGDLEVYLSQASGGSPVVQTAIDSHLSRRAEGVATPLGVPISVPGGGQLSPPRVGFNYTAPANVVLFVIINGFVAAFGIVNLRRTGNARRLLATPAKTWQLFGMLAIGPLQIMIAQAAFLIAITAFAFEVPWGDAAGVLLVTAALISVGVSLVFCMGTVFRTPEQATALGPLLGMVLGMLGGCLWPLEIVPPAMVTFGHLFPTAWAMDAYLALGFGQEGIAAVLPHVAVLFAMALALSAVGVLRLRPQFSR